MSEQIETAAVEETEAVKYEYAVAVRFRDAGKPYSFGTADASLKKGDMVVVETAQGPELGLCEADAMSIEKYSLHMPQKPVIRLATEQDEKIYNQNVKLEKEAFDICVAEIKELGLDMNLLSAQYTLDRSKILFVYLADQRVDFRELLKHLGSRLHCRIELRQIGERDKARMVGGLGMCGMECCCRRFKNHFDVISINMAKNQLLALNIEKLSGMCGKLMCCLKYEDEDYKELTKGLPKMGSQVEYDGVIYRITNMNVMSNEAKLENRESVIFITLEDLREKGIPRKGVVQQPRRKEENEGDKQQHGFTRKVVTRDNKPAAKPNQPEKLDDAEIKAARAARKKDNANKERPRRDNGGKRDNKLERKSESRSFKGSRTHTQNKPNTETRNITVRTFGKKKTEGTQENPS